MDKFLVDLIYSFVWGFLSTYLFISFYIKFAGKLGMVAIPNERTIHLKPIPTSGGICFGMSFLLGLFFLTLRYKNIYNGFVVPIIIGGTFTLLIGVIDDRFDLKATIKLCLQIIVVSFVYWKGIRIDQLTNPFGPEFQLHYFAYPVTLIWYLFLMNAVNLVDGMDGLASGIVSIASFVLLIVGLMYDNFLMVVLTSLLLSSNLAFLIFNFNPAKIFMGDSGALFLGFVMASLSIAGNGQFKGITAMTLLIPLLTLFVPIFDTLSSVIRRVMNNKHIFKADDDHLHHRLLQLGFSQKTVVLIVYFITFLFGLIALGFSFTTKKIVMILFLFMAIALTVMLYYILRQIKKVLIINDKNGEKSNNGE